MANSSNFVWGVRADIAKFLAALEQLQARRREYTALGGETFARIYFTANPNDAIDLNAAGFVAAIATIDALTALMDTGHATNLYTAKG